MHVEWKSTTAAGRIEVFSGDNSVKCLLDSSPVCLWVSELLTLSCCFNRHHKLVWHESWCLSGLRGLNSRHFLSRIHWLEKAYMQNWLASFFSSLLVKVTFGIYKSLKEHLDLFICKWICFFFKSILICSFFLLFCTKCGESFDEAQKLQRA